MAKNLHREPFDDETILKLEIFVGYLKEWLPVFLARKEPLWHNINVFDFFAGPGKDIDGKFGSPLLIIEQLINAEYNGIPYQEFIRTKNLIIGLYFNEYIKNKFNSLESELSLYRDNNAFFIKPTNLDFRDAFDGAKRIIRAKKSANLLFLDQNGVRHISDNNFLELLNLERTDFIGFISSSFLKRFANHDSFKKYLNTEKIDFEGEHPYHCHRIIVDYYRSLIPRQKEYYLAPFSIKKGKNIYGLIFGSKHTLGKEKFLRVCWEIDPQRGEANFDIDNEKIDPSTPSLFKEFDIPKKTTHFENELISRLKNGDFNNLKDLYLTGLKMGFLPKHVNSVLKRAEKNGIIKPVSGKTSKGIHKVDETLTIQII